MSVTFSKIPSNWRAPAVLTEVDDSKAGRGAAAKPYKVLIAGQKLAAGTLAQKTIKQSIRSADEVRGYAGEGSIAHGMAVAYYQQGQRIDDVDLILLDDNGAGVAAAITLTVAVTTAVAGTVVLIVAGRRIEVGVAAGAVANTIATDIRAAVNATEGLPVTASGATNAVILTCDHKGVVGNELFVQVNYYPADKLPGGVTISGAGAFTGGTSNPTIDAAFWLSVGETQYDVIVMPWADATNLSAMKDELNSRFDPPRQIGGRCITGKRDTYANLASLGNGQNCRHQAIIGGKSLVPPWERAARAAAKISWSLGNNPAQPLWTLELEKELSELPADRFDLVTRNLLYFDGISCVTVDVDGTVRLDRVISTRQLTDAGAPDAYWLDLNKGAIIDCIRWDWSRIVKTKFPRHLLAPDDTPFGPGMPIVTPKILRAEALAAAAVWAEKGWIVNLEQFERDMVMEIDGSDPTRANMILPPDIADGFAVAAVQIQPRG